MSKLVVSLGAFFILFSLWVLVDPVQVVSVYDWESRQGLYLAAGLRVVFGFCLVLGASSTRYPKGLRIFGGLLILAGIGLPFLPIEWWQELIRWWLVENLEAYRVGGGAFGVLLGAFLVHAGSAERPTD